MRIVGIVWAYFISPRRRAQNFLLILSLSAGVMVLIASLGIMNVLQQEIIGDVVDTQFHVQVRTPQWESLMKEIHAHPEVVSVVPFVDQFVMVATESQEQHGFVIRMLGESALPLPISESDIILTSSAANILQVGRGNPITTVFLPEDRRTPIQRREYQVAGVQLSHDFESIPRLGYTAFDMSTSPLLGIRLKDYRRDQEFLSFIWQEYSPHIEEAVSWRQLYRVLFTALRVEKITLILFVAFIFIIVAFAEYQLFQRALIERLSHVAMLRAHGVTVFVIRTIFLAEGVLLGSVGLVLGAIFGFLVVVNIPQLTSALLMASYHVSNFMFNLFYHLEGVEYYFQLPTLLFTQRGQIFFSDVIFICVIAFFIPFIPVIGITKRISGIHPREIMRTW